MIVLALGSNRSGEWGSPVQTVKRASDLLVKASSGDTALQSSLYLSAGVGPGQPANFVNAVVTIDSYLGPMALLRKLKQIERHAGSRSAMRWGPRALDLDIIDYYGQVRGWSRGIERNNAHAKAGRLVLPHPLMHKRPFVLEPLTEILPLWRHPVFFRTASELAKAPGLGISGRIMERLD